MGAVPAADEYAMALPRIAPPPGGAVPLPRPLPPSQAALVRRIFALQDNGEIKAAEAETKNLDTSTPVGEGMLGHILADRYLGPATRPDAATLRAWIDRYADLPDLRDIHRLLVIRLPAGQSAPPLPPGLAAAGQPEAAPVPEETEAAETAPRRNPELDRDVWATARRSGAAGVERLLRRTPGLNAGYMAQLRGEAARILFTQNRDQEALDLAAGGLAGLHQPAPAAVAGYYAGLAAFRLERFTLARAMFATAWRSPVTTPALKAASAYWAARAELRAGVMLGAPTRASVWLRRAAEQRRTFYGLLARRTLGLGSGFSRVAPGERETLGEADVEAVQSTPQGLRAFALLQVDEPERAAAELRNLWGKAKESRPLARAVMLVADAARLPEVAMDYADLLAAADGRPREGMRFPVPRLRPARGFSVDPALIYGITRAESDFNAMEHSPAGARGLMQIMPETASFLTGRDSIDLFDPAVNLDLGQRYVAYLAKLDLIGGDLIRLIAAYNTGPGGLLTWGRQIVDKGDPLLFLEAIPIDETRQHVPRVLTYTWIYAARLGLPAPSLDELAAGYWPRYHAPQDMRPELASLH